MIDPDDCDYDDERSYHDLDEWERAERHADANEEREMEAMRQRQDDAIAYRQWLKDNPQPANIQPC